MNKVIHFSITLKYSVYFLIPLFLIGCGEIGEPDEPPIPDYHTIIQRHLAGKIYGARITSHSRRGNFVTYLADGRITDWASPTVRYEVVYELVNGKWTHIRTTKR